MPTWMWRVVLVSFHSHVLHFGIYRRVWLITATDYDSMTAQRDTIHSVMGPKSLLCSVVGYVLGARCVPCGIYSLTLASMSRYKKLYVWNESRSFTPTGPPTQWQGSVHRVSSIIAQNSTSYGQISSKPKPRPRIVEAKTKATKFCPRGVLEVEASPRGPHPWTFQR